MPRESVGCRPSHWSRSLQTHLSPSLTLRPRSFSDSPELKINLSSSREQQDSREHIRDSSMKGELLKSIWIQTCSWWMEKDHLWSIPAYRLNQCQISMRVDPRRSRTIALVSYFLDEVSRETSIYIQKETRTSISCFLSLQMRGDLQWIDRDQDRKGPRRWTSRLFRSIRPGSVKRENLDQTFTLLSPTSPRSLVKKDSKVSGQLKKITVKNEPQHQSKKRSMSKSGTCSWIQRSLPDIQSWINQGRSSLNLNRRSKNHHVRRPEGNLQRRKERRGSFLRDQCPKRRKLRVTWYRSS